MNTYENTSRYKDGKIYKIWNTENDKIFIGGTTQILTQRMGYHRSQARRGIHLSDLHTNMKSIGDKKFRIELIQEYPCQNKEQLEKRIGHYIRKYKSHKMGYNWGTQEKKKTRPYILDTQNSLEENLRDMPTWWHDFTQSNTMYTRLYYFFNKNIENSQEKRTKSWHHFIKSWHYF